MIARLALLGFPDVPYVWPYEATLRDVQAHIRWLGEESVRVHFLGLPPRPDPWGAA